MLNQCFATRPPYCKILEPCLRLRLTHYYYSFLDNLFQVARPQYLFQEALPCTAGQIFLTFNAFCNGNLNQYCCPCNRQTAAIVLATRNQHKTAPFVSRRPEPVRCKYFKNSYLIFEWLLDECVLRISKLYCRIYLDH